MTPAQDAQGRYIPPEEAVTGGTLASAARTVEVDQAKWDDHQAVTGRPNDIGPDGPPANSTFAERAAARNKQQKTETAKADNGKPPAKRRSRSKAI